jgi:hypothetical protein
MAVGVLVMLPGVTQQQYEDVNKEMFGSYPMSPSDAPEGLVLHSAGPGGPNAWYVYDIWNSKEDFERFAQEKIGPAMETVMGGRPAEGEGPPPPEFYEIANLFVA